MPAPAWLNKYAPGSWQAGAKRPRFWLSTTVLVFVTDFWHFADSLYLTAYLVGAMMLGAALASESYQVWALAILAVKAGGGGVFEGSYFLFRIKK
ncbi:hypothetical protein ACFQT0_19425 [Hymenobacter humi]|uniref:Uncharacterized protein n=1 Tax=Hymenobacter humi TaxID=1411620 RepID=A0ABW2UAM5_9BACT